MVSVYGLKMAKQERDNKPLIYRLISILFFLSGLIPSWVSLLYAQLWPIHNKLISINDIGVYEMMITLYEDFLCHGDKICPYDVNNSELYMHYIYIIYADENGLAIK